MYNIEDLIGMAAGEGASDVHLIAGPSRPNAALTDRL